jgi:peptidoglycan/LPS O-acetylase OafA/YrhL
VIWWAGLELSKNENMALKNNNILFMLIPNIFFLSVLTILSYLNGNILRFGIYPVLFLRHFGFAFLFISLAMYGGRLKNILKKMLYPFLFIAPISYGIYIFHYPIFIQYSSGLHPFLDIPLKLFMLFLLSYVVEIKLQPLVNKVVKSTNRYSP